MATNFEYFKDEILEATKNGYGFGIRKDNGRIVSCPWCKQPGRILREYPISYTFGNVRYIRAGCVNDKCEVEPQTNRIDVMMFGLEFAIKKAIEIWEDRV